MGIEMRALGRTELKVSSCCLGTMTWGQQNTEDEGHQQMDYALERGVNFWDTAELYSIPPKADTQGSTERVIGSWFKKTGRRDEVILATKVAGRSQMTWLRKQSKELVCQTKEQIDEAIEGSLKRLQTDYIDLYQLHWPDRPVGLFGGQLPHEKYSANYEPFEEILDHLDSHIQAGRLRHIGVSNETPFGVMRFLAESEKAGLPRMASIQNAYNLVNRAYEDGGLQEVCAHEDVGLLAYSPLAQGYLTGKYRGGAMPKGSRKQLFDRLERYESPQGARAIESYLVMAQQFGVDPAKLAIRFCDTRPFMASTIIGATSMTQLETCIDAFDLTWTDEMEAEVNRLHAEQPSPCP